MIEGEFYGERDSDSWKWIPFGIVLSCACVTIAIVLALIVAGAVRLCEVVF